MHHAVTPQPVYTVCGSWEYAEVIRNNFTRRKTIAVHFQQSTTDNHARQTVNARRICNLRRDRHFTFAVTTSQLPVSPLLLASLPLIRSTSTSTLFHSSSILVHSYLTSPLQSVQTSKPQLLLVEYIQSWAGGRKVFDVVEDAGA